MKSFLPSPKQSKLPILDDDRSDWRAPEAKAEFYQSNDVLIFGKMSMVEAEMADVSEIAKEIMTSRGNQREQNKGEEEED